VRRREDDAAGLHGKLGEEVGGVDDATYGYNELDQKGQGHRLNVAVGVGGDRAALDEQLDHACIPGHFLSPSRWRNLEPRHTWV